MHQTTTRKYIFRNFRTRVFAYLIIGMTTIFSCFNIYFFQHERKHIISTVFEQGDLLVTVLAESTRLGVFAEDKNQLQIPMEAVLHHAGVLEVCLFNKNGNIILKLNRDGRAIHADNFLRGIKSRNTQWFNDLFRFNGAVHFEEDSHFEFWAPVVAGAARPFTEETLFFAAENMPPEKHRGDIIGFASLTIDKEIYSAQLRELFYRNLLMGVIFILLSISIGWLIVQEATSPLQRLIADIRRRGVELKSDDELVALSSTFENLVVELGDAFETINNLKQDLEEKVEQRTRSLAKVNLELADKQVNLTRTNNQLSETLAELQETQMHMIQSEKMAAIGQLVAGVAHEINNTTNFVSGALPPLGRILNNINRLLQRYRALDKMTAASSEEFKKAMASIRLFEKEINFNDMKADLETLLFNIKEGARRTTKIVVDLKNFSRPDKGNLELIDIHKHLDSTISLLHHELKQGIEVTRQYDPTLPRITCYSNQINQVFMNIMLNAIQAIKRKGSILVRTWSQDNNLHVLFRDDGGGIPEELLSRIFDPFFTLKEVGSGTGLGLSVSYSIIKKHHGEILVRSQKGKGSEFEIIIPVSQDDNNGT